MRKSIRPSKIDGTVDAPASKSVMLRAAAAALLCDGPVLIAHASRCDDALAAVRVISALGAAVRWENDGLIVKGRAFAAEAAPRANPGAPSAVEPGGAPQETVLDCGESGLSLRMFTPIAALFGGEMRLTGRDSLARRPVGPIVEPLAELGVTCSTRGGFPPVTVTGRLRGGRAGIDGSGGSQFLSGLLLALPKAHEDSVLTVRDLTSLPYVRLTLDVLSRFGVSIVHENFRTYKIPGRQSYGCPEFRVDGDWSGAAFLLVAAALAGRIRVLGLEADSAQADRRILEALSLAGAEVDVSPGAVEVARAPLRAFEFDITHCPDLAPPLVALAGRAEGRTVIRGIERLIHKESNRAESLAREFRTLGADIRVEDNRMIVAGDGVRGGTADSHGDHRVAMAVAVAALAADGAVTIEGAECVSKSYPEFFRDLARLGGNIHE